MDVNYHLPGFTLGERAECERLEEDAWAGSLAKAASSKRPCGFITHTSGGMHVALCLPQCGRWFIKGREVLIMEDRCVLPNYYFAPSGSCGGRTLT
jgi:hypothetical protein